MEDKELITEQEAQFCLLYVNAEPPLLGDALKCYKAVYGDHKTAAESRYQANLILNKECVQNRISELEALNVYDTASLKRKITSTLVKVMDECAENEYVDRRGKPMSPAAMRSVSVNAAKTLADIHGLKEDNHTLSINGAEGGVVFNINIPKPDNAENEFND